MDKRHHWEKMRSADPDPRALLRVSLAIPTRNRAHEIGLSLPLLLRSAGVRAVIVCDQSPTPVTNPKVLVLHRPNLPGLPAARNVLLHATTADVVLFLDDDTDVAPDLARRIEALAATEPHIAAWGPVVEARGLWPRRLHRLLHLGCVRDGRRLTTGRCDREVRELFGCCFAVRRSAALAIAGFDARLPGYALGEDRDFCWRLHEAGFRLRFAKDLRAHHRAVGGQRPSLSARLHYLRWFASRHGRGNPATVLHVLLAAAAWTLRRVCGSG